MVAVLDRTEREVDSSPGHSDGLSISMMAQKRFLEGLLQDPSQIEAFCRDPYTYARKQGAELDPDVIRRLADEALLAMNVPENLRTLVRDACPNGIPATSPNQLEPQGVSPAVAIAIAAVAIVYVAVAVTTSVATRVGGELPDTEYPGGDTEYPGEYSSSDYSDSDYPGSELYS